MERKRDESESEGDSPDRDSRIATEHVGKDICLQARIHFLRVIFRSHLGTQETFEVLPQAINFLCAEQL